MGTWTDSSDPAPGILVTTLPENGQDAFEGRATGVRLAYETANREYKCRVSIEYTECNFGGSRPWFLCPGELDGDACGNLVGKLYRPPRRNLFHVGNIMILHLNRVGRRGTPSRQPC